MAPWQISPRVATVGLLALVALDVALVGMALKSTRPTDIDTSPLTTSPASGRAVEPSASSSPTASASVSPARAPLRTMLVALDDQRAWRVVAGSCASGGAALSTTSDGGRTWTQGKVTLRRIVRLRAEDTRAAFVIGANSSCVAELRDTTDGGGTWTSSGSAESAWFRDPKNPRLVRAPGPTTSQPCGKRAVLDLAVLATESARVLCADGLVRSTVNDGAAWKDVGRAEGAVALAVTTVKPAQTYVARVNAPDCAGVQIQLVQQRVATSCIKATIPEGPGQIAMSLIDGGGWLAVGTSTMRSNDDLVTWTVS